MPGNSTIRVEISRKQGGFLDPEILLILELSLPFSLVKSSFRMLKIVKLSRLLRRNFGLEYCRKMQSEIYTTLKIYTSFPPARARPQKQSDEEHKSFCVRPYLRS